MTEARTRRVGWVSISTVRGACRCEVAVYIVSRRVLLRAAGTFHTQRQRFFHGVDWAVLDAKKAPSPLRREWYLREPDVARSQN